MGVDGVYHSSFLLLPKVNIGKKKKMNKFFLAIVILILSNILAWYQLNAQFKWTESAFWNNPYYMSIFGIPVGYFFYNKIML